MSHNAFKVLIVDDEKDYCDVLEMILSTQNYYTRKCSNSKDVLGILKEESFDLILSDLIMPGLDGVALLKAVKAEYPKIHFIILTAYGTIENAVSAMKEGAYTYVIKGSNPEELLEEIEVLRRLKSFEGESRPERKILNSDFMLETSSEAYKKALDIAGKAAKSDTNILILGESGAGKEVIAQFIHNQSDRKDNLFLDTNCHTFTESLLESELFGHEKGAFTGALSTRIGRFEAANGGTLFLDEIGDIPLTTQAKLLRAIETKKINRIGRNDAIPVDFRLISATNKNLEVEIKEGRFREDLFYRLSTIIIEVPPLRERREDLPQLIDFLIQKTKTAFKKDIKKVDGKVMDFLLNYDYPGNVRELKNIIERLIVLSDDGVIREEGIAGIRKKQQTGGFDINCFENRSLKDIRKEVELKYIESLLKKNNHNVAKTAQALGISRRQLFNKITEYGLK